jgi:hypothetical protein
MIIADQILSIIEIIVYICKYINENGWQFDLGSIYRRSSHRCPGPSVGYLKTNG